MKNLKTEELTIWAQFLVVFAIIVLGILGLMYVANEYATVLLLGGTI